MGCGWDGGEGLVPAGPPAAVWAGLPCLPVPPSPAYTHVQGSVLTAAVSRSPDRPSCSTVAPTPPLCQPGSRHSHTWETAAATTRFSSYHPGHKVPTRESHPPGGHRPAPMRPLSVSQSDGPPSVLVARQLFPQAWERHSCAMCSYLPKREEGGLSVTSRRKSPAGPHTSPGLGYFKTNICRG